MNRRQFAQGLAAGSTLLLAGTQAFGGTGRGKVPLKITDIQTLPIASYLFVTISTNEGIVGQGDCTISHCPNRICSR